MRGVIDEISEISSNVIMMPAEAAIAIICIKRLVDPPEESKPTIPFTIVFSLI